ncbi:hypothetical protein [Pseudonocardia sp. N23]|uniref:hypothetical protein n=1 Tax=Pseudonocardia sp. N23 TaxID=1987376 RepID=UPI000C037EFA|nr:hypothetical protein [Pseudonocardia sp. N23]GAY07210.1 dipeptide-binding ABC transporter, periplasmic substrate-binding component [Pseudonocardia sp. N23]
MATPFPSLVSRCTPAAAATHGRYSDPQVDALLDNAVATTDKAEQAANYKQPEAIAGKDLAIGWYSRAYTGMLTRKNVKGVCSSSRRVPRCGPTHGWLIDGRRLPDRVRPRPGNR